MKNGVLIKDENVYREQRFVQEYIAPTMDPQLAYLHITLDCNLNCEYCYNAENLNHKHSLSTDDWLQILTILAENHVKKVIITGGEPYLHEGLFDIVMHAKSLGLKTTLLTNGSLLDQKTDIIKHVENVIVSFDSLTNSLRKGIDHNGVLNAIIKTSAMFPGKINVRSVVVNDHEFDVENLGFILKEHGITQNKILCLPRNMQEISNIPNYDMYNLYSADTFGRCGAGDTILAIDSEGKIYPCQTLMKPEFVIGNILHPDWLDNLKTICFGLKLINLILTQLKHAGTAMP